jgi:hypothetical protein
MRSFVSKVLRYDKTDREARPKAAIEGVRGQALIERTASARRVVGKYYL